MTSSRPISIIHHHSTVYSMYLAAADPTQMTSSRPIPNNIWLTPHSTWWQLIQPKWRALVPFLSLTLTLPGGIWSNPNDELSSHFYLWALTLPFGIWSLPNDELSSPFYLLHSLYLEASDPTHITSYRPISIFDTQSTWWQLIPPKWRALVPCPAASHRPPPGPDQDQCHHKQVILHTGLYCLQLTPPLMFSIFVSNSYL